MGQMTPEQFDRRYVCPICAGYVTAKGLCLNFNCLAVDPDPLNVIGKHLIYNKTNCEIYKLAEVDGWAAPGVYYWAREINKTEKKWLVNVPWVAPELLESPAPSAALLDVPAAPLRYAAPVPALHSRGRGRPAKFRSNAEKQRAYRERMKAK